MPKWTCSKKPELVPIPIDPKRYEQILAEIAELLYEYWANSIPPLPRSIHCSPKKVRTPTAADVCGREDGKS